MNRKCALCGAFLLAFLTLPAMAAFIPPSLVPVTPNQDQNGAFIIQEGVLYQLPDPLAFESGDVLLLDQTGGLSDLVRFFNNLQDFGNGAGIGNQIFIYSDTGDAPDLPPDVIPIPTDRMLNVVSLTEQGTENVYEATPYQASLADGSSISYVLVSDAVPEPSTMLLLGAGLAAITLIRRRIFAGR